MDLQAYVMLADHAEKAGGKLFINGGGWAVRRPEPIPWALALEVKVPWHDNNRAFKFKLEMIDADGAPFEVSTPDGDRPLSFEGEFRVTAGPQKKPGSTLNGLEAVALPPIPLPPGETFEWKLSIDGATRDEWRVSFDVSGQQTRQQEAA